MSELTFVTTLFFVSFFIIFILISGISEKVVELCSATEQPIEKAPIRRCPNCGDPVAEGETICHLCGEKI